MSQNKLSILIALSFVLMACSTTSDYVSSDSLRGSTGNNNPSLSLPKEGIHPYFGVAYNDKQGLGYLRTIEKTRSGTIVIGFNYQPALDREDQYGPFYNVSLTGSYINYKVELNNHQIEALNLKRINYAKDMNDYKIESLVRAGFLRRFDDNLFLLFALGTIKYEEGEYSNFRKQIDGVMDIYNLAENNLTYGFGVGFDLQNGKIRVWDVGILCEAQFLFNKTQTISYSSLSKAPQDIVITENGDPYRAYMIRLEPYIDYKNIRISLSTSNTNRFSFQLTYRL